MKKIYYEQINYYKNSIIIKNNNLKINLFYKYLIKIKLNKINQIYVYNTFEIRIFNIILLNIKQRFSNLNK